MRVFLLRVPPGALSALVLWVVGALIPRAVQPGVGVGGVARCGPRPSARLATSHNRTPFPKSADRPAKVKL